MKASQPPGPFPSDKEFERIVEEIWDALSTHGLRAVKAMDRSNILDSIQQDPALAETFVGACHDGYQTAQFQLVTEVLNLQNYTSVFKEVLKAARRARNTETQRMITAFLAELAFRQAVCKTLANCLAWTVCGHRRWVVKRFYLGKLQPHLATSNIEHALATSQSIHQENPLSFALIADLTSVIQVGDLLLVNISSASPRLTLIELKEGKVNERVAKHLEGGQGGEAGIELNSSFAKQVNRNKRQLERMGSVLEVVNNDVGTDLLTDLPVRVQPEVINYEAYDSELEELLRAAKSKGSSFAVLDEWLMLGAYVRSPLTEISFLEDVFEIPNGAPAPDTSHLERSQAFLRLKPAFPIQDLGNEMLSQPLAKPIFLRGIDRELVLDLVFKRIRLFAYIDFTKLIEVAKNRGLELTWSSKKTASQNRQQKLELLELEGRNLIAGKNGYLSTLGTGLFAQVLYDGMPPATAIEIMGKVPE